MRRYTLVALAVAIVLVGGWLASWVQTAGGDVRVTDARFAGQDGRMLSGLLYVPANATNRTPAPGLLLMHGYINSRETQSGFAIEFARRGYVTLSMDMAGHGYSDPIGGDLSRGAYDGLRFLASLPFVDAGRIGVEGHSMGGWSVLAAADRLPELVKTVVLVGSSSETLGAPRILPDGKFNVGVVFSRYDEFAQLMWGVPRARDIVRSAKLRTAFGTSEEVEPYRLYGDFGAETARMLYIPDTTHPGAHLSREAIGNALDFVQASIPAPRPLDPSDQIWPWKELGTTLGLVGAVLFLFGLAGLLLDTPYFKGLVKALPPAVDTSRAGWVVGAMLTTAIPAITFFRFQHLGNQWIPTSAFWPQSLTIGFMVWALLNAGIALVLFGAWHLLWGRRRGGGARAYGLSTAGAGVAGWRYLGRALLLAVIVTAATHALLSLVQWAFLVDFRFWVVALKPMDVRRFLIFLRFLVPFAAFFVVWSMALHGQLRLPEYGKESTTRWVWMVANGLVAVLGLAVLVALQVGTLKLTERLFFPTEPLLGIVAYQFLPLLAVAAVLSTYLFRRTGTIYPGAFLNALFVTWYIVAGQAIQFAG
ncbi:alpha/beta hydrolase family protein [Geochorda subterranea]|uniref:Alpha/beta fold hydrolase n=1 Tax=Geochorda subterranea TaxID=3109564 RepID=A0ABZ1BQD4_9FIRM|nr:alpha/beta fold hydrolase [Limnochorda sp. LNt]WRP14626.1 alpha/beta fold hydrolase [Limnochorda sp. LNt]